MNLNDLRIANRLRQQAWPGSGEADVPFRTIEVCGETGELAEAIKKWLRSKRNIEGTTASLQDVKDEIGDVVISLDLLAAELGINLGEVVSKKFNKTSEKYGLPVFIPIGDPE